MSAPKKRLLVVGSANMDFVCRANRLPNGGETLISDGSYSLIPGGKGANGAISAVRLGCEVIFCCRVGADLYGDELRALYEKEGMDCRYVFRDNEVPTGLAQIFVEESGQNRITVFPGANKRLTLDNVEEAFTAYPDGVLLSQEIDAEEITYSLVLASRQGVPVFVDPAPARDDFDVSSICACEVFSPNETETAFYTDIMPSSADSCLRAAMKLYKLVKTKYVVLKLGEKGCFIYDGTHQEFIPSLHVNAVDTTGAGDCFTAALATRYLHNGGNIVDACRFGCCAAAYSVTRQGAEPSFPNVAQLGEFVAMYNKG